MSSRHNPTYATFDELSWDEPIPPYVTTGRHATTKQGAAYNPYQSYPQDGFVGQRELSSLNPCSDWSSNSFRYASTATTSSSASPMIGSSTPHLHHHQQVQPRSHHPSYLDDPAGYELAQSTPYSGPSSNPALLQTRYITGESMLSGGSSNSGIVLHQSSASEILVPHEQYDHNVASLPLLAHRGLPAHQQNADNHRYNASGSGSSSNKSGFNSQDKRKKGNMKLDNEPDRIARRKLPGSGKLKHGDAQINLDTTRRSRKMIGPVDSPLVAGIFVRY